MYYYRSLDQAAQNYFENIKKSFDKTEIMTIYNYQFALHEMR